MFRFRTLLTCCAPLLFIGINGCSNTGVLPEATTRPSLTTDVNDYQYLIGPGDSLTIFVWRNPEVSGNFIVRPDGKVTTSLVEDIDVAGRTPTMLAREIEEQLSTYINNPRVTVSVNNFSGPLSEQVRVIGEATNPSGCELLRAHDVTGFNDSRRWFNGICRRHNAKLVRVIAGKTKTVRNKH